MKVLKSHIQLTALVLSFVFTNTVLAAELTTNENKDNGTGNTVSNADLTNNAGVDTASPVVKADTVVNDQQAITDTESWHKQMDERRLQVQKEQQEAYERFLERRKQNIAEFNNNIPAHVQERRNQYMKEMEERRALNVKMMEQHRKAAEERRETMQIKMHQTDTTPEVANKA